MLPERLNAPIHRNIIREQFAKGLGKNVLTLRNGGNNIYGQSLQILRGNWKEVPGQANR